jgi:hypothetical protein
VTFPVADDQYTDDLHDDGDLEAFWEDVNRGIVANRERHLSDQ